MHSINIVNFTIFFVAFCSSTYAYEPFNYYWRSYSGRIPEDAVPGGLDKNNKTTYIGNVFVNNRGIQPVRIYPGKDYVVASANGIYTKNKFIQILCSTNKYNFIWLPVTSVNLHTETIGKHLVEGGVESKRILNIGRVQYQGELIVGKVSGYKPNNAKISFAYDREEVDFKTYEVLICKEFLEVEPPKNNLPRL